MVVLKVIVWNSSNFNISSCNSSGSNKIDSNCDRKIVMTVAIIEEGKHYNFKKNYDYSRIQPKKMNNTCYA